MILQEILENLPDEQFNNIIATNAGDINAVIQSLHEEYSKYKNSNKSLETRMSEMLIANVPGNNAHIEYYKDEIKSCFIKFVRNFNQTEWQNAPVIKKLLKIIGITDESIATIIVILKFGGLQDHNYKDIFESIYMLKAINQVMSIENYKNIIAEYLPYINNILNSSLNYDREVLFLNLLKLFSIKKLNIEIKDEMDKCVFDGDSTVTVTIQYSRKHLFDMSKLYVNNYANATKASCDLNNIGVLSNLKEVHITHITDFQVAVLTKYAPNLKSITYDSNHITKEAKDLIYQWEDENNFVPNLKNSIAVGNKRQQLVQTDITLIQKFEQFKLYQHPLNLDQVQELYNILNSMNQDDCLTFYLDFIAHLTKKIKFDIGFYSRDTFVSSQGHNFCIQRFGNFSYGIISNNVAVINIRDVEKGSIYFHGLDFKFMLFKVFSKDIIDLDRSKYTVKLSNELLEYVLNENVNNITMLLNYRPLINNLLSNARYSKDLEKIPVMALYRVFGWLKIQLTQDEIIARKQISNDIIRQFLIYCDENKTSFDNNGYPDFFEENLRYLLKCDTELLKKFLSYVYVDKIYPYVTFEELSLLARDKIDLVVDMFDCYLNGIRVINDVVDFLKIIKGKQLERVSLVNLLTLDTDFLKALFNCYNQADYKDREMSRDALESRAMMMFKQLKTIVLAEYITFAEMLNMSNNNIDKLWSITAGYSGSALVLLIENKSYTAAEFKTMDPNLLNKIDSLPTERNSYNDKEYEIVEEQMKSLPLSPTFVAKANKEWAENNKNDVGLQPKQSVNKSKLKL